MRPDSKIVLVTTIVTAAVLFIFILPTWYFVNSKDGKEINTTSGDYNPRITKNNSQTVTGNDNIVLKLADGRDVSLQRGYIAFKTPTTVKQGEPEIIELVLSRVFSPRELAEEILKDLDADGAEIQISNLMEARLTATKFSVESLMPEKQAISAKDVARWSWYVTGTESGPQNLHLTLSALITVAGANTPFVVRTFDRVILVQVNWGSNTSKFLANNWQWLWATMLVPIGGLIWRYRNTKSQNT